MDALDWQLTEIFQWISYKSVLGWAVGGVIALFLGIWMFAWKNYDLSKGRSWKGEIVKKESRKDWYDFFRGKSNRNTTFFWKVKLENGKTRWIYAESARMYHMSETGDPVVKRNGETTPRLMSEKGKKRRKNLETPVFK